MYAVWIKLSEYFMCMLFRDFYKTAPYWIKEVNFIYSSHSADFTVGKYIHDGK